MNAIWCSLGSSLFISSSNLFPFRTVFLCMLVLFVLLLFLMVLGMFAFFHIPTQKIKNSETSSGMQEEAQAAPEAA